MDPESDLQGRADAAVDASLAADSGTDAAAVVDHPFCLGAATEDADLCDDFNDRSVLVFDGGPWVDAGCSPASVNGNASATRFYFPYFEGRLPNDDASVSCYLESAPQPAAEKWTLGFDLDSSFLETRYGDAAYLTIARLDFTYDASVDGSALYQSIRLLVGNDNSAQLVEVEQRVGQPAPQAIPFATLTDKPFLSTVEGQPCRITMTVSTNGIQTSTASSSCAGTQGVHKLTNIPSYGLLATPSGSAVLFLGFDDPGGGDFLNAGTLDYDNVVLFPR